MNARAAILWDESYLWGLLACRSLREAGLPFDILSAAEVRSGKLEDYSTLLVPGGWASNKIKALGEEGAVAIRSFTGAGGSYVGLCGGAGLATNDGLGLLDISRKPLKERVPSLSGPVRLTLNHSNNHPLWQGLDEPVMNLWWPSQFVINDKGISVLASFESAMNDAYSSDINVGDVALANGWEAFEKAYGLNLNPSRMHGDPIVVEATHGRGRVILSLAHFDTPGDMRGALVLRNLWKYLDLPAGIVPRSDVQDMDGNASDTLHHIGNGLCKDASLPFEFGLRNFLWFRRGPLVQWRRGVRGLEYFTLYSLTMELARLTHDYDADTQTLAHQVKEFSSKALRLLMMERMALQRGEPITFAKASGDEMSALREEMFSRSKSHGGMFKDIITELDRLLLIALKRPTG